MNACQSFNDADTALCTKIERDFLRTLLGGCSTPISALAEIHDTKFYSRAISFLRMVKTKLDIRKSIAKVKRNELGILAARELLVNGGQEIADSILICDKAVYTY